MAGNLQLSARSVAAVLAHVFGPSFYDDPRFGRGDLGRRSALELAFGIHPDPWRAVALNPQPLPPRVAQALALADAHIQEVFALDRIGALLGGEVVDRAQERAQRLIAEIYETCPRWPRWPKRWPPVPGPRRRQEEEMTASELLVFGARLLAAADVVELESIQRALGDLGERALEIAAGSQTG